MGTKISYNTASLTVMTLFRGKCTELIPNHIKCYQVLGIPYVYQGLCVPVSQITASQFPSMDIVVYFILSSFILSFFLSFEILRQVHWTTPKLDWIQQSHRCQKNIVLVTGSPQIIIRFTQRPTFLSFRAFSDKCTERPQRNLNTVRS